MALLASIAAYTCISYFYNKVDVLHVRLTDLHAARQNLPFPPNTNPSSKAVSIPWAGCDKYTSVLNFVEIARTSAKTCEFQYYASLA